MDQLCGVNFEELSLRQVIANARARLLERCEPLDADFVEWLWGLTGETPPAARPKRHPPVRRHRVRPAAG